MDKIQHTSSCGTSNIQYEVGRNWIIIVYLKHIQFIRTIAVLFISD